jgi:hypothetical protein
MRLFLFLGGRALHLYGMHILGRNVSQKKVLHFAL